MSLIRRALIFAYIENYLTMVINLAMVPVVSRLMGPTEFGISVLGLAALAIANTIREFGGTAYVVQEKDLTLSKVRTVFTIGLILTLLISVAIYLLAKPVAQFYRVDGLELYLEVVIACYLLGPIVSPIHALQRRDMQFATIAVISLASAIVNVSTTILLAYAGFSYMSFAWANLTSGATAALLGLYFRPEFAVFRPSLANWREVIGFGRYAAFSHSLAALWDYVPYLIFGRILDPQAVGLYQRANMLANLPRRTLLGGFASIVLSTMSIVVREGDNAKESYFRAVRLVTALHLPSLIVLVLLAHPIVRVLFGPRWLDVPPFVQIVSLALMLNYSVTLTYPTLVAIGAVRDAATQYLITVPLSTVAVYVAAHYGLWAVAASMFFTVPLDTATGAYFLQRHLHFRARELIAVLMPSLAVTFMTALGPALVIAFNAFDMNLGVVLGACGLALAGAGWFAGLYITSHPLLREIWRLLDTFLQISFSRFARQNKAGKIL